MVGDYYKLNKLGTYWANRILVIEPSIIDAVVLDSVCPPIYCTYVTFISHCKSIFE